MRNKGNKKRINLSSTVRMFISGILVIVSGYLIWSGVQDLKTTLDLKSSISENTIISKELADEVSELEQTKKNLTNPDYMKYYARGEYMVTKEGEQVFKFPSSDSKSETSTSVDSK